MASEEHIPTDLVHKLAKEGKTEPEIISSLRSHGFTPKQIDIAMRSALKNSVERLPPPAAAPPLRPPELRSPPPHGPTPFGVPPEHIQIPKELMPLEIGEPMKLASAPHGLEGKHPVHGAKPPAKPEHGAAHLPKPLPVGISTPQGSEIGIEELVEAIVNEHIKDFQSAVDKAENTHRAMTKQIDEMHALDKKLEDMEKSIQANLKQHLEESRAISDRLASRVAALETSFKELASWMKKK